MQPATNIVPMPTPPKRFVPPTVEECQLQAAKIGLSPVEAEKFHCYYEANGWKVGRVPMQVWRAAMSGWKLRWQERVQREQARGDERKTTVSRNVQLIQWRHELDRVEAAMKRVKGMAWTANNGWDDDEQRQEHRRLRLRKEELLKELGMAV